MQGLRMECTELRVGACILRDRPFQARYLLLVYIDT